MPFDRVKRVSAGMPSIDSLKGCVRMAYKVLFHLEIGRVVGRSHPVASAICRRSQTPQARGTVELFDFDTGDSKAHHYIDEPPYGEKLALELCLDGFVSTSCDLVIWRTTTGESSIFEELQHIEL